MRSIALFSMTVVVAAFSAQACITKTENAPAGAIPADPGGAAPEPTLNNLKPQASFAPPAQAGGPVRVTLLGLLDPTTSQPIPFKANESVWVTEDGVLKGIRVTQAERGNQLPFDIAFVVDNSGSMGEEADGVADKIAAFAGLVQGSGADVRLGVVGFNGKVSGALNLGDATAIDAYLKREGQRGTSRTVGFGGDDAAALQAKATADVTSPNGVPSSENAIAGIVFAESAFKWRENAQRVFIVFTDEPTQPGNKDPWKTKTLCARWKPQDGTIHTVWSGTPALDADAGAATWVEGQRENPGELAHCTPGGVVKSIKADATDLDLTTLPLTDALRASALVEFNSKDPAVAHEVSIVVKNGGSADGKTVFSGVKY